MIKFTVNNLKKLETLLEEAGYTIRYERGNFNSGYCILEQKKVIVISKFFQTESRMNTLLEILSTITIQPELLSEKTRETYYYLQNLELDLE